MFSARDMGFRPSGSFDDDETNLPAPPALPVDTRNEMPLATRAEVFVTVSTCCRTPPRVRVLLTRMRDERREVGDVTAACAQLAEGVAIADDLAARIHDETGGRMRLVLNAISRVEHREVERDREGAEFETA